MFIIASVTFKCNCICDYISIAKRKIFCIFIYNLPNIGEIFVLRFSSTVLDRLIFSFGFFLLSEDVDAKKYNNNIVADKLQSMAT